MAPVTEAFDGFGDNDMIGTQVDAAGRKKLLRLEGFDMRTKGSLDGCGVVVRIAILKA